MKRCPRCKCGAELKNNVEYALGQPFGIIGGIVAGMAVSVISRPHAAEVAKEVLQNSTKNVRKHFKCTNNNCLYEWDE